MKNPILAVSLVILLCFTFACRKGEEAAEAPKISVETDVAAIKASIQEWVQLYNAGDFDKLVSNLYAEDAVLMSPNEPPRKGKEAILLGYQKNSELNDEHCDSSVVEDVRVSGGLAVARGMDTGTTTPRSGGEPVKYDVKWLIVLERQSDGTWKYIYEMWNDDNPLPETPEKGEQE